MKVISIFNYFLVSIALFMLVGCATRESVSTSEAVHEVSIEKLNELLARRGLGHVYFMGTDATFDYFATHYYGESTKYYRVRRESSQSVLSGKFFRVENGQYVPMNAEDMKVTRNKSEWIPYIIDLSRDFSGFVSITKP
jgi:hypothetical protein